MCVCLLLFCRVGGRGWIIDVNIRGHFVTLSARWFWFVGWLCLRPIDSEVIQRRDPHLLPLAKDVKLDKHTVPTGNEEQIISGCPIDGAIWIRVDGGFGHYRWFVYITLLLRDASWILILHCGPPEPPQRHLYCKFCWNLIEPRAFTWQSITLPLRYANSTYLLEPLTHYVPTRDIMPLSGTIRHTRSQNCLFILS